jgi:hypothetical protein
MIYPYNNTLASGDKKGQETHVNLTVLDSMLDEPLVPWIIGGLDALSLV